MQHPSQGAAHSLRGSHRIRSNPAQCSKLSSRMKATAQSFRPGPKLDRAEAIAKRLRRAAACCGSPCAQVPLALATTLGLPHVRPSVRRSLWRLLPFESDENQQQQRLCGWVLQVACTRGSRRMPRTCLCGKGARCTLPAVALADPKSRAA